MDRVTEGGKWEIKIWNFFKPRVVMQIYYLAKYSTYGARSGIKWIGQISRTIRSWTEGGKKRIVRSSLRASWNGKASSLTVGLIECNVVEFCICNPPTPSFSEIPRFANRIIGYGITMDHTEAISAESAYAWCFSCTSTGAAREKSQ